MDSHKVKFANVTELIAELSAVEDELSNSNHRKDDQINMLIAYRRDLISELLKHTRDVK